MLDPTKQRESTIFGIGTGVLVSIATLILAYSHNLSWIEAKFFDEMVQTTASGRSPDDRIIVITIDDASLKELEPAIGRWPWPRAVTAAMIDYCSEAKVIVVDVLTPEQDARLQNSDDVYAASVRAHGRVVTAVHVGPDGDPIYEPSSRHRVPPSPNAQKPYAGIHPPYAALESATAALGVATQEVQRDGVLRHYNLTAGTASASLPSLALAAAALGADTKITELTYTAHGMRIGNQTVLAPAGRLTLNPSRTGHRQISAADILAAWQDPATSELKKSDFRDRYVIIGSTASGLAPDHEVTAFGSLLPGVFINAFALDNILNNAGFQPTPPPLLPFLVIAFAFIPGLCRISGPKNYTLLAAGGSIGYALCCIACFFFLNRLLPTAGPLVALNAAGLCLGLRDWRLEELERRRLEALEIAKQTFTDMLVHDLKNRVGPISMALTSLQSEQNDNPLLEGAQMAAKRLENELISLLEIRKISDGKMRLKCRSARLERILRDLDEQFAPFATNLGLTLKVENPKLAHPVWVDPAIIDRIASNLIWNAFDHTPSGKTIILSSQQDECHISLVVSNPGRTLTEAEQREALEPFSAGDQPDRRTKSGTGLGLTFCNLATAAHGGTLTMLSPCPKLGEGVCVTISLPIDERES